jgi:hypothetical protein
MMFSTSLQPRQLTLGARRYKIVLRLKVFKPGADPTIVSYNAGAVEIYNAKGSLVRSENKIIFFYFEKRSSLLHTSLELELYTQKS